ncbi:hypothetical protein ABZU25_33990 [Micromonospora sp. NPDC005215]|uniref:hypothetical protein n=1 Tax=Micromonospora sp. NPDC005215 TaxID=3157024 RepID=UPI0033BE4F7B
MRELELTYLNEGELSQLSLPRDDSYGHDGRTDRPNEGLDAVRLVMDESGNGNASQPLIVGAVELGDDADDVEQQIRDLYKRLCAKSSFVGYPGFDEFRKNGFHSASDPPEVVGPFLELMRVLFFRAYMVVTDRTTVPGNTEVERIEFMYTKLLSDLLIRHRDKPELLCMVEQSEGMGAIIRRLSGSATRRAHETLGKVAPLPKPKMVIVAKTDYMSVAIIDYIMSAVSRWLQANRPRSPKNWPYRAFREIEPSISLLYSFEHGRISSRREPLH